MRNWRTYEGGDPANGPLRPGTIDRRMDRYGRGLGLSVGHNPDTFNEDGEEEDIAPTPYKNRIETAPVNEGALTSEHEFGHAMMTPPGKKMRPYFKWLHRQNEVERTTRHFQERNSGTERSRKLAEERIAPGSRHESVTQAMGPAIQRRAGVQPGAQNIYWPQNERTEKEHQQLAQEGSKNYGARAQRQVQRWDDGQKFDSEGRVITPSGPDAAINERARIAAKGKNLVNSRQAQDALRVRGQMSLEKKP